MPDFLIHTAKIPYDSQEKFYACFKLLNDAAASFATVPVMINHTVMLMAPAACVGQLKILPTGLSHFAGTTITGVYL